MKGFFKKSTALVLALMMVLSLFAGMTFTANADTEATVSYTYFEDIEDNYETADYGDFDVNISGGTYANGMYDISDAGSITLGDSNLKNYVFDADFYIGQKDGSTTDAVNTYVQFYTLLGSGIGGDNGVKNRLQVNTQNTGTLSGNVAKNVGWQDLSGGTGSCYNDYSADSSHGVVAFSGTELCLVNIRIEVQDGVITHTFTYGDTTKKLQVVSYNSESLADKSGQLKINLLRYDRGLVCKLDNIKMALLDTATLDGEVDATLSTTTLAPGTPDDNTGIVYGGNVDVDVFGQDVALFFGDDVTIEADGYDYNKEGLRVGANLLVDGNSIGRYNITYRSPLRQEITTASNGWAPEGTFGDFIAEYDYIPYLTNYWAGQTLNTYIRHKAKVTGEANDTATEIAAYYNVGTTLRPEHSSWDGESYPAVNAIMYGTPQWRIGNRTATGWVSTSATVATTPDLVSNTIWSVIDGVEVTEDVHQTKANMEAVKIDNPTTYRFRIEAVGKNIKVWIVNKADFDGTWGTPTFEKTDYTELEAGNFKIAAGVTINNGFITEYDSYSEDAYKVALAEDATITFNPADGSIATSGNAVVNYYGFKENGTIPLSEMTMYYNGDGTVTADGIVLPCTVTKLEGASFDCTEGFSTEDWTIGDGVTMDGGKILVNKTNSVTLNQDITDFVMEYTFTPYHMDYTANPVPHMIFRGGNGITYELGAFYNTTKAAPAEGASAATQTDGNCYKWRLMQRKTGANITNIQSAEPAVASNTLYTLGTYVKLENPTSYRIRVEATGADVKVWIATIDGNEIVWSDDNLVFDLTDFLLNSAGYIKFTATADEAEAEFSDVTIEEIINTDIIGYESAAQALPVGASAEDVDTAFKGILANGTKFDMYPGLITGVEDFDSSVAIGTDVNLVFGDEKIAKRVIFSTGSVTAFEDFSSYAAGETTAKTGDHPILWNTENLTIQNNGMAYGSVYNCLVNNSSLYSNMGGISADIMVPGNSTNTATAKYFGLSRFNGYSYDFVIATTPATAETGKAYAMFGYSTAQTETDSDILICKEIDFAFDTLYRVEYITYGNTLKGLINGQEVLSCVVPANTGNETMYNNLLTGTARYGFFGHLTAAIKTELGEDSVGNLNIYVDNIIRSVNIDAYNITAADGITVAPTKGMAGDKIVVTATVNRNGALLANDEEVFLSTNIANGTFGGDGTGYVFTMPAEAVELTFGENTALAEGEYDIATIATGVKTIEGESGVRFLNRLYLPAIPALGNIEGFGAEITLTDGSSDKVYDAIAYSAETACLYDVTAKYVDFAVVALTSDYSRSFTCKPYVVIDGAKVYGTEVSESINTWLAK